MAAQGAVEGKEEACAPHFTAPARIFHLHPPQGAGTITDSAVAHHPRMSVITPSRPTVTLIAAVARNGAIGRDNALLWHLPEDLKHFKRTTLGCPVVMGRKTWDSLGRPLPGRHNIVLSRDPAWSAPGATAVADWAQALRATEGAPRVFVIGGAQIYALALPHADELILTEVDADAEGDTHFPAWDRGRFTEALREAHHPAGGPAYAFVTYRRQAPR
jgi:dihydrofolate reductase